MRNKLKVMKETNLSNQIIRKIYTVLSKIMKN